MSTSNKTKIIFMGGDLIGCRCLRYLHRLKNTKIQVVVGCYLDNGSVIDPQVWNASIARVALGKGIPFIQPKTPSNLQFINDIQKIDQPDIIVTAGYDKNLDPALLSIPKLGTVNLHFSLLPKHRGYFPVTWSILEDDYAGVTLHWVNEKINAGDIIGHYKFNIEKTDTAFTLYHKLTKSGIKLLKKYFPQILKGTTPGTPQIEANSSYHPSGYPYQRIINWYDPNHKIERFVRSLTFPGFELPRTFLNKLELSILPPVTCINNIDLKQEYPPGTIVDVMLNGVVIKTGNGGLLVKKVRIGDSMPIDALKMCRLLSINIGDSFMSFDNLYSEGKLNLVVP